MGRKKIPPPKQTFFLGDRVAINTRDFENETGIITHVSLTGTGSYQEWAYFVTTHRRWTIYKGDRLSIRCYKGTLTLLVRKQNYWTEKPKEEKLAQIIQFPGTYQGK